jgi:hypothetical protein
MTALTGIPKVLFKRTYYGLNRTKLVIGKNRKNSRQKLFENSMKQ